MSADRIPFTYWSDPLCIWAFVAQQKLDRILDEHGPSLDVDYRVVPVFGSVRWRFAHGPWTSDGVAGRVEATRRIVREHGREDVSGACWQKDPPASSWSPGMAIKAVCALEREESIAPGTGARYQRHLREAFFVEERNVARREVQLELLEAFDVRRGAVEARLDDGSALAALWEDHRDREARQIQGSPTFELQEGRAKLYGNFPYGILEALVDELVRGLHVGASQC